MNGAMMMDRAGMMGMSTSGTPAIGQGTAMSAAPNMMMVPRCTIVMEKCAGGMKMTCTGADAMSTAMIQNLCTMTAGGLCSCCCMMNGMMACCCNMTMAMTKCEMTADGVCITCTSGDAACCAMIQACCDCCTGMMKAGCTCCIMMNGMPVCCGC